MYIVCICGPRW